MEISFKLDKEKMEEIKNNCLEQIEYNIKEIQADAVKEFAERLKEKIKDMRFAAEAESQCEYIDDLVNEMIGGD